MIDRRRPEAVSLRLLFQEQWELLRQLVADWQDARLQTQSRQQVLDDAIEAVVSGTDVRLRALSNYQQQLRQSTRELLLYIEDLVSMLPTPVLITKQTMVMDPSIGSMFQDLRQVERLIRDHRSSKRADSDLAIQPAEIYALFSLFRFEKQSFGSKLHGEILVSDVLQTHVSFVGHEVIALEETEIELRSALKRTLFESVVSHIRLETLRVRHARSAEEQRRDVLDPSSNHKNPAVYLKLLQQLLASPRDLLNVQNQQLRINAMGIKLTTDHSEQVASVRSLDFNEISIGDKRPRVLYMTRHPLAPLG